jgi:hypothetical protein
VVLQTRCKTTSLIVHGAIHVQVSIMLPGLLFVASLLFGRTLSNAFSINRNVYHRQASNDAVLSMGLIDSLSNFLQSRDGDFIKLEETESYGPGPAIILYKVPSQIDNEEIQDILSDGAPKAHRKGVRLARIDNHQDQNNLLECSVETALSQIMDSDRSETTTSTTSAVDVVGRDRECPVVFFSGFDNREMMAAYNIIASQIYLEVGVTAACAKAVPNAMGKTLKQVLEEIAGDHLDATSHKR